MAGTAVSGRARQEIIKRPNNQERQEVTEQTSVCVLRGPLHSVCWCVSVCHRRPCSSGTTTTRQHKLTLTPPLLHRTARPPTTARSILR